MANFLSTAAFGIALSLGAAAAVAQNDSPHATLSEIEGKGKVLVNRGEGFVSGAEGVRLSPGDRIMVQEESSALVKFDDECQRTVEANTIATVPDRSNCAGGVWGVQTLNPASGSAIGATGGGATGNGAVVAMAGIVAAIDVWWLNEDDEDVVSP